MADISLIIALIWVFYLVECVVWGRRGIAHFRTIWGRDWRLTGPSELAGGAHGGILLRFPFTPLGVLIPAPPPLVAFSPEGICGYVSELDGSASVKGAGHYLYKDIVSVGVRDREVLINGRLFVRAHSKAGAKESGEFIRKVKGSREADRKRLLEKHVRALFDVSGIEERVDELREETSLLAVICNFLWLYLMVGIPTFLIIHGFSRVILPYLALVVIMHFLITAETFRAYRVLYERRDHALLGTFLPSPFNSIRAMDILSKELLLDFHPFAVSQALLTEERFLAQARHDLARIVHPIYDAEIGDDAQRIDRWYKGLIALAMKQAVEELGIDPGALVVPERDREDGRLASYCPRCLSAYEKKGGPCADCPGMELMPFEGRAE